MSEAPEQVSVTVNGKDVSFWSEIELHLALDAHPVVSLVAPFEPERKEFRKLFVPFSRAPVEAKVGGQLLFTGMLIDVLPQLTPEARYVGVTAYARPAKLLDSDMPHEAVPFEVNDLTLTQIARKLCEPLGIGVVLGSNEGSEFHRVRPTKRTRTTNVKVSGGAGQETITEKGNVQDFLAELARQRGLVMTSTAKGELLFQRSIQPGKPVAKFEEGVQPLSGVSPQFNPQEYYSEITGVVPARRGRRGFSHTEQNPFPPAERVCMSFDLDDTEAADAPAAVKAKMGRMFANMCSYTVLVPTWRNPRGKLWTPNETVTLKAPTAMVYRETELLIRDVILRETRNDTDSARTAELVLVLPGAFSGGVPPSLPWVE